MTPFVWKDADEAAFKFPKPNRPRTTEELINEAHDMFQDERISYAAKAGFYYGLIQLLEAERKETNKA